MQQSLVDFQSLVALGHLDEGRCISQNAKHGMLNDVQGACAFSLVFRF